MMLHFVILRVERTDALNKVEPMIISINCLNVAAIYLKNGIDRQLFEINIAFKHKLKQSASFLS